MKKKLLLFLIALIYLPFGLSFYSFADTQNKEQIFLENLQGQWVGPGQVVAGKYKGTNFTCTFLGVHEQVKLSMILDGTCRVGIFSQNIKAKVAKIQQQYQGTFNDGAQKNGMDIISGQIGDKHMMFDLVKDNINGTILAYLADKDTMNITLSIKVSDALIPVIDVKLKRNYKNTAQIINQTALR